MEGVEYRRGNELDLDEIIGLYRRSTPGERRPVDRREIMAGMLAHADLVITAWRGAVAIGIARTLTDWEFRAFATAGAN
ncbi:MAG TPA: hypothetical protein VMN36_15530 [Verrucomicrobiales bacterium]|nr:hypothetical protein [Verrucomicrobiales bacterium]